MDREEALKIVRENYPHFGTTEPLLDLEKALATLIPELAESEDERIRKSLLAYIKGESKRLDTKKWIAYLEKQKEQKPAEWSEEDKEMLGKVLECIRFAEDRYQLEQEETNGVSVKSWLLDHIIPQQKPEWSEEDEKKIIFLERLIEYNVPDGQYGWVDGMKGGFVTKSEAISMLKSLRPSQKLNEEEIKKIRSEEYTKGFNDAAFGGKLKEWSVEDEDRIRQIERIAQKAGCTEKLQEEIHDWLRSRRPQYHGDVTMTEAFKMGLEAGKASSWEPSEEDLMMLEHIIRQYETGNKNSKVMGYLPRIEELDFLKKVFAIWKS